MLPHDDAASPPPASAPTPESTPAPAPSPPPRRANWALLAFLVSVTALIVATMAWYQSAAIVEDLRTMRAEVDAGRTGAAPTINLIGAPALGPADARIAFVEFSDYECPYCIRHFRQTMPQIDANYIKTGKIRYVFMDWPVDQLHPEAIKAHEAGHCAGEQQRFWQMHSRLFGPPGSHSTETLTALAQDAGLNVPAFSACLASGRTTASIRATARIAEGFGASGTPSFFLGIRDPATDTVRVLQGLAGAQPYEEFARVIDALIDRVK